MRLGKVGYQNINGPVRHVTSLAAWWSTSGRRIYIHAYKSRDQQLSWTVQAQADMSRFYNLSSAARERLPDPSIDASSWWSMFRESSKWFHLEIDSCACTESALDPCASVAEATALLWPTPAMSAQICGLIFH